MLARHHCEIPTLDQICTGCVDSRDLDAAVCTAVKVPRRGMSRGRDRLGASAAASARVIDLAVFGSLKGPISI